MSDKKTEDQEKQKTHETSSEPKYEPRSKFGRLLFGGLKALDVVAEFGILRELGRVAVKRAGEAAGDAAHRQIRKVQKEGNDSEFYQALSELEPEEQEFIDSLMNAMRDETQRAGFRQAAALTGPEVADTAKFLKTLCNKGDVQKALRALQGTHYLEPKKPIATIKDQVIGDMSATKTTFKNLLDQVNNEIRGNQNPNTPGGAQ